MHRVGELCILEDRGQLTRFIMFLFRYAVPLSLFS